jgi:acetylornithine deacetylase/succinyl-diaminopimelate desuccinylase family protein
MTEVPANLFDRLETRIDGMTEEIVKTVQDVVRIESVNPTFPGPYFGYAGGEGQVSRYLAKVCEELTSDIAIFGKERGRDNVVAVMNGRGGGRSLVLNGHVDVVPPGEIGLWDQAAPFSGSVSDGRIWGRGTADQKAGLVSQTMAAIALSREGIKLRGNLLLEAVVGEENMEHDLGVSAVIERGYRGDGALISEGTCLDGSFMACPKSASVLWFRVTVRGKATHSSSRGSMIWPGGKGNSVGVNAIEKGLLILNGLRNLEHQWGFSKNHELFTPGHFTIHPGVIAGGPHISISPGIVAEFCTIDYNCWFPPVSNAEEIKAEISAHIANVAETDSWLCRYPPEVEWMLYWPALDTDPSHPLVTVLLTCLNDLNTHGGPTIAVPRGYGAVCDGAFIQQAGIPAAVLGPGSLYEAHSVNESVLVSEVVAAAKLYALAAMRWCGYDLSAESNTLARFSPVVACKQSS